MISLTMKVDVHTAINFVYIHTIHNVDTIQIREITSCKSCLTSVSTSSLVTRAVTSSCCITPWIDLLNGMKIDINVAINFVYIHIIHNVDAIQIRAITHCMSSCTSVSPISFLSRAASFSCYITSWIDLLNDTHSMQSSFSYTA